MESLIFFLGPQGLKPSCPSWLKNSQSDKIIPMDEQALIHDAQAGSLDAFNTLILHYQDSIFNTALRILSDEDLAADATQEAFLSAFKSISSFRGGSFKAWLMRTVTNACYDELRRQKRRPTTPLEPDTEDGDEMDSPRWLADPNLSPEQEFEADELEHALQHCLNNLPLEFKTVVVMADVQGMDYSEVAIAVRVPLGTIKSRLARARLRLRECLQGFTELLPAAFRLEEGSNA
ncbi:MAG: sigma-70 family RNA polymerase sigma factor [Chloroflexi bacterium]|nr:MAG: sigma-70 family RNA polymerase sigma factor [Chloroflexota bacterium]